MTDWRVRAPGKSVRRNFTKAIGVSEQKRETIRPRLPSDVAWVIDKLTGSAASDLSRVDLAELVAMVGAARNDGAISVVSSLATRVLLGVMDDLIGQGWRLRPSSDGIRVMAPDAHSGLPQERSEVKARLRASLVAARDEQLTEPATQRFVFDMERPRWFKGRQISVQDLFVNPSLMAHDLERRIAAPHRKRDGLLDGAIQPYLQLATEDPDEHSGLRLMDIWRYARYTWSLPYNTTPGRRMQYLVRDAARDLHPIIGIGALGSSMVQISPRDLEIGWDTRGIRQSFNTTKRLRAQIESGELKGGEAKESLHKLTELTAELSKRLDIHSLLGQINDAISETLWSDLVSEAEVQEPTAWVLERLQGKIDALTETSGRTSRARADEQARSGELEAAAKSSLYLRKRAVALQKLLRAKRALLQAVEFPQDKAHEWLLTDGEGQFALSNAFRSIKKKRVGSAIMDITTCGAVPPYSTLIGGKLVSLLMASPKVIRDYRERYGDAESVIASRMKGEPVVRPADLVLLCTTSLYGIGSSQYNRLKATTTKGKLEFREVGRTFGYGSVHISERTFSTMKSYLEASGEAHSYSFAAGVNYKIRTISSAVASLGLSQVLQHRTPRIVYLVPLTSNWREYLTGNDETPDFIYESVDSPEEETQALIEFWKTRWLQKRVKKPETIRQLKQMEPVKVSRNVAVHAPLFQREKVAD